jgi:hypothetical protein
VDAEVLAEHHHTEADIFEYKTYLLRCPSCKIAIVGVSERVLQESGFYWSSSTRVYPAPRRVLRFGIPKIVASSMNEAEKCMHAGAYVAATAMSGRALEAICRHFNTSGSYLGKGLKELREKEVIDNKLYEWGEELREQRNMAAHATDIEIPYQDAKDVLAFTYAIIDYVFLLTIKFENFKKRKKEGE